MRTWLVLFGAWAAGAAPSVALRAATGWSSWEVGEAALILAASVAVLGWLLHARPAPPRRNQPGQALVPTLLAGWLVIQAANDLATGRALAGLDSVLYIPALIVTVRTVGGQRRARLERSQTSAGQPT